MSLECEWILRGSTLFVDLMTRKYANSSVLIGNVLVENIALWLIREEILKHVDVTIKRSAIYWILHLQRQLKRWNFGETVVCCRASAKNVVGFLIAVVAVVQMQPVQMVNGACWILLQILLIELKSCLLILSCNQL